MQLCNFSVSLREKYGVFSGPYFPAFGLNTGKNGPEKTQYLDIFSRSVDKYLFSANVCRR